VPLHTLVATVYWHLFRLYLASISRILARCHLSCLLHRLRNICLRSAVPHINCIRALRILVCAHAALFCAAGSAFVPDPALCLRSSARAFAPFLLSRAALRGCASCLPGPPLMTPRGCSTRVAFVTPPAPQPPPLLYLPGWTTHSILTGVRSAPRARACVSTRLARRHCVYVPFLLLPLAKPPALALRSRFSFLPFRTSPRLRRAAAHLPLWNADGMVCLHCLPAAQLSRAFASRSTAYTCTTTPCYRYTCYLRAIALTRFRRCLTPHTRLQHAARRLRLCHWWVSNHHCAQLHCSARCLSCKRSLAMRCGTLRRSGIEGLHYHHPSAPPRCRDTTTI